MAPFKSEIDRETAKLRKLADVNIAVHTQTYEKILLAHLQQCCAAT